MIALLTLRIVDKQRRGDIQDPEEEEEDEPMDVQPMTPLFTTTTALIKRRPVTSGSPAAPVAKSVGDASDPPRVPRIPSAYSDPLDGYLSEGGASLYARKLNYIAQRNKDEQDRWDSIEPPENPPKKSRRILFRVLKRLEKDLLLLLDRTRTPSKVLGRTHTFLKDFRNPARISDVAGSSLGSWDCKAPRPLPRGSENLKNPE